MSDYLYVRKSKSEVYIDRQFRKEKLIEIIVRLHKTLLTDRLHRHIITLANERDSTESETSLQVLQLKIEHL